MRYVEEALAYYTRKCVRFGHNTLKFSRVVTSGKLNQILLLSSCPDSAYREFIKMEAHLECPAPQIESFQWKLS
ncbi:MAG: hypothetical protein EHM20_01915 [Alphaproteobacteria bacterium]|nr:MAG: hypothetical protein EHM20_01915 [Alphaproteobacteria bacterium]